MRFPGKFSYVMFECKIVIILLLSLIEATAAQTIVDRAFLSESERTWIAKNPIIKSSINTSYAPIDFVAAGEPTGFSVDYLNLVAAKVGLIIEYVDEDTLSNNLEMLRTREIDIVHSISENEERAKHFIFSNSYLDSPVVNYGRAGASPINTIADLEDKKVAVVNGTILHDSYRRLYPQIELVEFNYVTDALRALAASEIDVYTGNLIGTDYLINQTSISGLEVIGNDLVLRNSGTFHHSIATHKDNQVLMAIIKKGMAVISETEYTTISEKWISTTNIPEDIGLTVEEKEWLSNNPRVGVAAVPGAAPFEFVDQDGKISGMSGAYLDVISKKLRIDFYWVENQTLSEGFDKIKASEAYVSPTLIPSAEREEFLYFSDSYRTIRYVIFARSDNGVFGNLSGLYGRKIAQVSSFAVTEYIQENHPEIEITQVGTVAQALHMVADGNVDAFIGSIPTAASIIAADGLIQVKVVGETQFEAFVSIGVSKEVPFLYSAIQKVLKTITASEHDDITKKWMALRIEEVENYDLIWQIALGFSIILFVFLIWNRKLAAARMEAVAARKEAEEANVAKSAFFASISHDLRTPLNAIIGFSEVIKNETFGPIENEKYKEYNLDINKSGEYLLGLVNDILDVSALEAGEKELCFEMIDFSETAAACQTLVHKLAEDKNIKYTLSVSDDLPLVYADERAIMQVLMNLVSNAIKFTPEGGQLKVSAQASPCELEIEVSDTGVGISEEDISLITEPFTRAQGSPHHSRAEGTGLGLAIVKALVELHGGTLKIKSTVGEGTQVTVRLPINEA